MAVVRPRSLSVSFIPSYDGISACFGRPLLVQSNLSQPLGHSACLNPQGNRNQTKKQNFKLKKFVRTHKTQFLSKTVLNKFNNEG